VTGILGIPACSRMHVPDSMETENFTKVTQEFFWLMIYDMYGTQLIYFLVCSSFVFALGLSKIKEAADFL
jgi:hypothetical protein